MMLDQRDLPGDASGIILLNLYSDDGLGSTNNSALWNSFMVDFKVAFNVLKRIQIIYSVVPLSGIQFLVCLA